MPVLRISLIEGRSAKQKAEAAAALTQVVETHFGTRPEDVTIIFDEHAKENWAVSGKLLSKN
jgi:4-oxalocrotonate tautomerase family enzyme